MDKCIHDDSIEKFRQAVFRMFECVSPEVSNSDFHDAVNAVFMARKRISDKDIKKIKWDKYDKPRKI